MMDPSDEATPNTVQVIYEKVLAMRDVLVVLTALVARREGQPDQVLASLSNGLSLRIDRSGMNSDSLERIRAEIDWIVGAAHKLYRDSIPPPSVASGYVVGIWAWGRRAELRT